MTTMTTSRCPHPVHWLAPLALLFTVSCTPVSTPTAAPPSPISVRPTATAEPSTPTATVTPRPTATPTKTPRPTAPPEALVPTGPVTPPPSDFDPPPPSPPDPGSQDLDSWIREYVGLVTAMLNSGQSVSAVLDQLARWSKSPDEPVGAEDPPAWAEAADLDGDGTHEWLMALPVPERGCWITWCPAYVVVFEVDDELFIPGQVVRGAPPPERAVHHPKLLEIDDINADAAIEVLIEQHWCGAHTCFSGLTVGRWDGGRWHDLAEEPISQAYTELKIEDRDGDGALEFIMHGGMVGSAGAGLQREQTLVWAWEDGAYRLVEDVPDPSDHPYYLMLDANRALAEGEWDRALELAGQAVSDPNFDEPMAPVEDVDKRRIVSYAGVEVMLVHAQQGDVEAMEAVLEQLRRYDFMAPNIYLEAADTLLAVYRETGDPLAACSALEDYVAARAEEAAFFQWYGYNTTRMTVDEVCPLNAPRDGESPQL